MDWKSVTRLLKKKDNWIRIILTIIPITLMVWTIGQVMILSKYNGLILFSWTQVINDTVLLIIPIMFGWVGIFFYSLASSKHGFWFNAWKTILALIIGFIFIVLVQLFIWKNPYLLLLFSTFLLGILSYVAYTSGCDSGTKEVSDGIFDLMIPSVWIIGLILIFMVLFWVSSILYSGLYKDIKIEIKDPASLSGALIHEDVKYMNDKYIIYWSGNVMLNSGINKIVLSQ